MGGRLKRAIRLLAAGASKTAGRNSAGRITSFHRGGGHKRSYRTFDLKRAIPSVGIVERIEYDPNRSGRIALVRWTQGVDFSLRKRSPRYLPAATPRRVLDRVAAPTMGIFSVLKGESNGRILESPKVSPAISFTNPFFKLQCSKQKDVSRAKSASKSEGKVLEREPAAMKEVNSEKVVA